MAESTERELYGDLGAITGHQKSIFFYNILNQAALL
jgi:hypothetical protein